MSEFTITIRFYEELNDFLKKYPRKEDIPFTFKGKRSVKDLIEGFGIPHVEVDLILVNGESVNFSYQVKNNDRISVYPVFERLNIQNATALRERPLRNPRFVLDVHLGKLARDLRMLGFDTLYSTDCDDETLAQLSSEEERILLTRDRGLLMRKIVTRGLAVRSDDPEVQLREILEKLDLKNQIHPLSRCLSCNNSLGVLETDSPLFEILSPCIPPRVREEHNEYSYCPACEKVFWKGSHYDDMMNKIKNL